MRILTNVSKAELDYLTNQPTAKAMIEKVKTEGVYIPEGDEQGASDFVAMRNSQKQKDLLQISDEGRAALEKENETKDNSRESQIKEEIAELRKELAEIKAQQATTENAKKSKDERINSITQQISMLTMQLAQVQKENSESGTI